MSEATAHNVAQALAKLRKIELAKCLDPFNTESRPTEKQDEVLQAIKDITARYVVAANQSGKSQLGGRETSWIFEHKHPYWDTKAQFGDAPLLLIVMGRVGEQVESELWSRKIKPFLTEGTYKEVRMGGSLQRVIHKENGNTIVFLSHHNVNEARQKAQAFTAAYVWLDEMPNSISLLIELILRVQANRGRLLATFTPLIRNQHIKDHIEKAEAPNGQKFKFAMLDNPIYKGREAEVLSQYAHMPQDERNARLFGDWFKGGRHVYTFNAEQDIEDPDGYHSSWPHLELVDPAASGKTGFVLLANKPGTQDWYAVRSEYVEGDAPSKLLDELAKRTDGYNIIRRISDPHEAWFIKEAAIRRVYYAGVYKKNERKHELIKGLQTSLIAKRIKITSWATELLSELDTCMWADDSDKIIGAHRFHLLDCLQYGNDNLPKMSEKDQPQTFHQRLKDANKKRREKEAKKAARNLGRLGFKKGKRWRA